MNFINNDVSYAFQISINKQSSQQDTRGAKEKMSIPPFHTLQPHFITNLEEIHEEIETLS